MVPSSLFLWQKRCLLAVSVSIGFVSISCFGESAFFPVQSTPYDRQMTRVYPALNSTTGKSQGSISLDAVNEWMTELRAMPYHFSPYWQTPTEVSFNQTADCKGKAVALYALMRRYGAKSVRVVIGRRHIYDSNTHAWLEWTTSQGSYTLDPTFNEIPVRTADLDPMTYVASYAFDGEHKYRASRSSLVASNTRVATGYNDHLYAQARTASPYTSGGGTSTFGQPTFTAFGAPQFSPPSTNYSARNTQYRTQYQQTITPASWSQARNPSPYVARPVPAASPGVRSNPVSLSPVYPRPIVYQIPIQTHHLTTQTRLASVHGGQRIAHSISRGGTPHYRHVQHVAQHRKHLTQPKRLASQS